MEAAAGAPPPPALPVRPRGSSGGDSSGSGSSPASSLSRGRSSAAERGGGGYFIPEVMRIWVLLTLFLMLFYILLSSLALHFSSSSDDEFEMFLVKMKTPKSVARPVSKKEDASLKDFIDDSDDFFLDFKKKNSTTKSARKNLQTPKKSSSSRKESVCSRKELPNLDALSDGEDSITVESLWHDCQKQGEEGLRERCTRLPPPQNLTSRSSPDLLVGGKERNHGKERTEDKTPALAVRQSTELESDSSDSEFECLIERIRKQSVSQKLVFSTSKTVNQPSTIENRKPSWEGTRPSKGEEDKKPRSNSILPKETPSRITSVRSSGSESGSYTPSTQTKEKCNSCSVPGCFLQDLSNPSSQFAKYFKKNKEDLTQKLYRLYNNTIFEQKLPEKMEIIWNKKMRKTAGYCITGQTKSPEGQRYARIELSEKVCDSADRLRDTLIHEICHAATWLINGVRDGHGRFWRFYAKKSALIHPELPMVTRCHTYEIKYKFTYECVSCKNTIGRHSKSLDTERFVCAQCGGQLVLSQPTRKDGTPARTHLTPFAKYVKENYGSTKKEQGGLSHVEVMRKLSADFALKTRLQDSL